MAAEPKRIRVAPGSELARLLEEAGPAPLLLERNGELYRLNRLESEREDIWAGYDAQEVRQALKQSAGALTGVNKDKLLADIREQRGQHRSGRHVK